MKFKLAIADQVTVPVSFRVADGAKTVSFNFSLIMDRQTDEQWNAGVKGDGDGATHERIKAHLVAITKDWKNQAFVLDDQGKPADFCAEALEVMLSSVGVADAVLNAYMKENSAKAKNS